MMIAFALSAAPAAAQESGPGGPILVITSSGGFGSYYAEILRAEGLNEFAVRDLSTVNASTLDGYDVVILADMPLDGSQAGMLGDWVGRGGNLIAMKPDADLATLLGLSPAVGALANGYLKVDTTRAPGAGIVGETIQYHGTADRWSLNGATSVATLYSDGSTATASPAVTVRNVGANGGQAAAFTFDLARSVATTRQGNPDWRGQERDNQQGPIRANDLFFGALVGDLQPDWIDLSKVGIPQADEQQRLLANLIGMVAADRKPLPRFWYLPRDAKAAVVMTGDDHAQGGTSGRFDSFRNQSPAGCSVAAWQCIRGTSYVYPNTSIPQADQYAADGFDIALHVTTNCGDWTPPTLEGFISDQLTQFRAAFPSLPPVVSNRTHCIAWSDWASQPKIEGARGMRLDTNYYYWPGSWVANRPGFFTGSGIPMRFADLDGSIIDTYQAATQMTDESGQEFPFTINSLLDGATGPSGYYGVFTANMHTDFPDVPGPDGDGARGAAAIVSSAKDRDVPVVSAKQMLAWLDGRNTSSFGSIAWSGRALSFTVTPGPGANGLRGMVPASANGALLETVTRDDNPVTLIGRRVKGVDYAFFDAAGGSYVATYGANASSLPAPPDAASPPPRPPLPNPLRGSTSSGEGRSTPVGCLTLKSSSRRVRIGRRSVLTATVLRRGRGVAGVRVTLTGKRSVRTNRAGRVRFVVRPRRKGTLRLRALGQRPSCKAPIVLVRAR